MVTLDLTILIELATQLGTALFVTIPQAFINELLDGGVIRTIWVTLVGDPNVIKVGFLLALMGGVYLYATQSKTGRSRTKGAL